MLPGRPDYWLQEAQAADAFKDEFLGELDATLGRYTGPEYRTDGTNATDFWDPENHAFEWISLMVPMMVYGNPRVKVSTSRLGETQQVAKALQLALNRWIRETNMRRLNEKLAVDFSFRWCTAIVTDGPRPGLHESEDPVHWPQVKRISPRRFIWDPAAIEQEDWRWSGHMVIEDKDDVLARAGEDDSGWNYNAVDGLSEWTNGKDPDNRKYGGGDFERYGSVDRHQIAYWEIYVPRNEVNLKELGLEESADSHKAEDGWSGVILTIGHNQATPQEGSDEEISWIRSPRWYWGPIEGPYVHFGTYTVPDESASLSPLAATAAQVEELNNHARAMSQSSADYKKIILVSDADTDLQMTIEEGEHHNVYACNIDDLNRKVVGLELGGITQQHVAVNDINRARVDRNSGLSEIARGNVDGDATATAVAYAQQNTNARSGFVLQKFRDGIQKILERVAWFLENDEAIVFLLGEDSPDSIFVGGKDRKAQAKRLRNLFPELAGQADVLVSMATKTRQPGESLGGLDLEIEPYSMQRSSEASEQARFSQLTQFVMQIVPMMVQFPYFNWTKYLERAGEVMQIPDIGEYVDTAMAQQIAGMMLQTELAAPQGTSIPQPRMGQDVSGGATRRFGGNMSSAGHPTSRGPDVQSKPVEKQRMGQMSFGGSGGVQNGSL